MICFIFYFIIQYNILECLGDFLLVNQLNIYLFVYFYCIFNFYIDYLWSIYILFYFIDLVMYCYIYGCGNYKYD